MKIWFGAALAATLVGGPLLAQRGARLPDECRQQIWALCQASMGGGMRDCVRRVLPQLSDPCRKAVSDASAGAATPPPGMREVAFGADPKQRLDYLRPAGTAKAPILLFVHGGGWAIGDKRQSIGDKAGHFSRLGWAFASTNYRLVPSATVEQQAADVASAIAWLRANAGANRLDPDRIVLMGHSAGAHLAALVATDPTYLAAAGVPFAAVKGVVLLDGRGYDVARQAANPRNRTAAMYGAAFGTDPARQARLSPTRHAAAPNAPDWLILPVATRADSSAQSRALAEALTKAGARATVTPISGTNHGQLNRNLGKPGDPATAAVDRFLAALR